MEERPQKILSAAGVCSRRGAEEYIAAGRVKVNGAVASIGDKADAGRDAITIDGKPLPAQSRTVWVLLNKPRGCVTTLSDEKGRRTAAELVKDCGCRVWPVGRLDMDSEGLLLFTNDGEGTDLLLHPSHEVEKEYRVTVEGDVKAALPILSGPITLDGVRLAPAQVKLLGDGEMSITIHQGKNRQVRRMCALAGLKVKRLQRVREGMVLLGELPLGKWRFLTEEEVRGLTYFCKS